MSNDVTVTLAGYVGTTPKLFTSTSGNDYTSFRIASTRRYLDRARGEWVDGRTIWFTVKAWKGFAKNIAASLRKGDAVVVSGRLAVDEWTGPEGPRSSLVIEATAVGPDLARGEARFAPTVHRRDAAGTTDPGRRGDGTDAHGVEHHAGPDGGPDAGPDAGPGGDPWALVPDGLPGEVDELDAAGDPDRAQDAADVTEAAPDAVDRELAAQPG
ncbi:single-stranded DNA-binding protein [Oerskovia flava]|uniref:single-stranded DNA-binding protein n=1 Tax=Oerskovia flava TaxID=2986422 RepID=UPI0022409C3A|nr:single-stranded DNA-binding protein [Oerskovia sp. JB1-3-2]